MRSLLQLSERLHCHIRLVVRMILASLEANLGALAAVRSKEVVLLLLIRC